MLTQSQIAADTKLCEEATEGPWRIGNDGESVLPPDHIHEFSIINSVFYHSDAAFIARSRSALPEYIAEVERLQALLDECAAALREVEDNR